MKDPVILLYYKYVDIPRPRDAWIQQRAICHELNLKGRILLASEGINGTIEGNKEDVEKYVEYMNQHPLFKNISYKYSPGTGSAFPKLIVRVRKEIVTSELGEEDVNPQQVTGKYLSADELQTLFESSEKFHIVDMRNDYEQVVGHFENSILPGMENFRDLKKITKNLEPIKDEKIITVCTGGVRCEKASGYLVSKGFKDVYQLKDGIVSYMEKYPNQKFKGKLYVFDNRIMMGFDTDKSEIISQCGVCGEKSENYTNCADDYCHKHFICCEKCLVNGLAFCSKKCETKIKEQSNVKTYQV